VKAGKARYIGASSMFAWQFAKSLHIAERRGWTRFVSMQNHLNLLSREEEREMLPLCRDEGIGVIPWSPLARGRLTRGWDEATDRIETDDYGKTLYNNQADSNRAIIDQVGEIAAQRGVSRAQVALAWVLAQPGVAAPIVGASRISSLEEAAGAIAIKLGPAELAALEEPYTPRRNTGFA